MKYILIIILSLLMVSCYEKPKVEQKPKPPIELSKDNKNYYHRVVECTYEGCEYIKMGYGKSIWGSHKGNCNNPIHKSNNIDLSALDSVGCILDWYVQDGVLKIRTTKDEINDELQRLKYIQKTFYE